MVPEPRTLTRINHGSDQEPAALPATSAVTTTGPGSKPTSSLSTNSCSTCRRAVNLAPCTLELVTTMEYHNVHRETHYDDCMHKTTYQKINSKALNYFCPFKNLLSILGLTYEIYSSGYVPMRQIGYNYYPNGLLWCWPKTLSNYILHD